MRFSMFILLDILLIEISFKVLMIGRTNKILEKRFKITLTDIQPIYPVISN
jgi:hypothetical protein